MFLFTRDGRLQNLDFMYAFFLGVGILFINFIISNRMAVIIENLFTSSSRTLKNFLDIIIPAVLCGLAAWLLFRLIKKKKIVLMAYCFSLAIPVIFILVIVIMVDRETVETLLPPFLGIFAAPGLAGMLTAALLYRKWLILNPDPIREEERELAARQ